MVVEEHTDFDVEAFLAKADGGKTVHEYAKGKVVFSQGDPADAVFYVQQGQVSFRVVSEQGKEAIVALLGVGSFFGESCLAGQRLRTATCVTSEKCRIMRLEKAAILRLIHDETEFSEKFIAHLLERSIRIQADLVDQLFNSSEKRLARLLLLLANFGKDGTPMPVIAQMSQETLAQMIGTTRARVSHFMNKFRDLGFIDYNGGIEIHSSLLNVVLHDQPEILPDLPAQDELLNREGGGGVTVGDLPLQRPDEEPRRARNQAGSGVHSDPPHARAKP